MMLKTHIPSLVLKMAIPTIISMLVTSMYHLADTYFIATVIQSDAATAAVNINSVLDNLIMMAGSFLAVGANSYIARLMGAGRNDHAEKVLSTAFFSALGLGLLVTVLGFCTMEPMLTLFGAGETTMGYSVEYARYVLYAAPFMAASFVLNQCLRSEGSALYSMIGMISGAVLNVGLDWLFMVKFGWGMTGAAAATAIGKAISFGVLLIPYFKRRSILSIRFKNISYSKDIVTEIFKMGNPSLARLGLSCVATALLNNLANGFADDSVIAAITIVNRVVQVITSALLGFGQGFQPVVGFNWGAKRYDRVMESFKFASIAGVVAVTVMSIGFGFASEWIMRLFDASENAVRLGTLSLVLNCAASPFHAWGIVVTMAYAGAGKGFGATMLSLCRQGLCFIPLALLLNAVLGADGLAATQAAADVLTFFVALPLAISFVKQTKALMKQQAGLTPSLSNPLNI